MVRGSRCLGSGYVSALILPHFLRLVNSTQVGAKTVTDGLYRTCNRGLNRFLEHLLRRSTGSRRMLVR